MERFTLLPILSFFVLFVFLHRLAYGQRRRPYPPGPKGFPIIGNPWALQPKNPSPRKVSPGSKHRWERYVDWSRQYNSPDIVSVPVFGERVIILNSKKAVDDLLDKRSAKYSDRPGGSCPPNSRRYSHLTCRSNAHDEQPIRVCDSLFKAWDRI